MSGRDVIEEPAAAAVPDVSGRRLVVGLCTIVVAIAFETIAVATAMPAAARDLDGLAWYAWLFSAFGLGMLFATVVAGRLSDRIGPAKPLLAGMAVFGVGLLVSGTATTMAQLVAGRGVQGLGAGVINTAIFVCVAQLLGPAERPRMMTYISTAWVLPSFVGPLVAAWLTEQLSWHWVFHAVLPLTLAGAAMVWPTLRTMIARHVVVPPTAETARPAPLWAAGVVAAGAGALQLAGQGSETGAAAGPGWAAALLAVGGLVALVVALPRLMPAGFVRFRRGLSPVIVARGLLAGAFVGGEAFVPLMLVELRQVPLLWAGLVLTVGSVGWTTGSWLQSRSWVRLRRDRFISLGCVSVTLGLAVVAAVAWWSGLPYGVVAVGWVLAGLGMGLAMSSTSLAVMTLSADAEQGRNGSSLNLSDSLGCVVFVGVAGTIFTALHGAGSLPGTFAAVSVAMAVVGVLAALASLRIGPVRDEVSA